MTTGFRLASGGLLAWMMLLTGNAATCGQPAEKTLLPAVSYAELGKMVRGLKGKVAIVYFWADY